MAGRTFPGVSCSENFELKAYYEIAPIQNLKTYTNETRIIVEERKT